MMRGAWLATMPEYRTRSLAISGLTVRVFGELAIASFVGDLVAPVRGRSGGANTSSPTCGGSGAGPDRS
jgi:hypothetical protein